MKVHSVLGSVLISIRVLEKAGLQLEGEILDDGLPALRYFIRRPNAG